jgi:hypothetical protein
MNLKIGNYNIKSGEKKNLMLQVVNSSLNLPMTVVCGEQEGPTILVSAGIHGAEYIGIQTAMELSSEIKPQEIKGNIIFLLNANPQAFYSYTRFVVPEDGKNLNRVFPGNKEGTLSDKIAYTIVHDLLSLTDYYIDLHAGDTSEKMMPFVYFQGVAKEDVVEKSRQMAMVMDVEVRVKSSATTGAYNFAGIEGIPGVLLERGGGGSFSKEEVMLYKQDVKNILIHTGILRGKVERSVEQKEITHAIYINAEEDGFWYPKLESGDYFSKGTLLGEIKDVWGNVIKSYYAEKEGVVLFHTMGLGVQKEEPLIAYAFMEKAYCL